MPQRVPFDDLCCRLVGLGDPTKWQKQYRPHDPYERFSCDAKRQLALAEMCNRRNRHGADRDLVRTPAEQHQHAVEYHRERAKHHLQQLGFGSTALRQLGLQGRYDKIAGTRDDARYWSSSQVKQFFDQYDKLLIEFLKRDSAWNRRPFHMSDIVNIDDQREIIAFYLNESKKLRVSQERQGRIRDGGHKHHSPRHDFVRCGNSTLYSDSTSNEYFDHGHEYFDRDDDLYRAGRRRHRGRHERDYRDYVPRGTLNRRRHSGHRDNWDDRYYTD